jgi:hypothetical protein
VVSLEGSDYQLYVVFDSCEILSKIYVCGLDCGGCWYSW